MLTMIARIPRTSVLQKSGKLNVMDHPLGKAVVVWVSMTTL